MMGYERKPETHLKVAAPATQEGQVFVKTRASRLTATFYQPGEN